MNLLDDDIVNKLESFVENSSEVLISGNLFYSIADQLMLQTNIFPYRNIRFNDPSKLNVPEGDIIDLFISNNFNLKQYLENNRIKHSITKYNDLDLFY